MKPPRGLTIYFVDGTSMRLEFPAQADNAYGAVLKMKEVIKDRQLILEVEGALLLFPFENIKYFQIYPVPVDKLPSDVVKGARIVT